MASISDVIDWSSRVTTTYFLFFEFIGRSWSGEGVMNKGQVDYASVNNPITSRSSVIAGQKERAPIAINRFDCVAYELYDL